MPNKIGLIQKNLFHLFLTGVWVFFGSYSGFAQNFLDDEDSTKNKVYKPSFKPKPLFSDRLGDPFSNPDSRSPLFLPDPDNFKTKVEAITHREVVRECLADLEDKWSIVVANNDRSEIGLESILDASRPDLDLS